METICNRFAQMGYTTISIDYRTRWKTNQSESDKGGKTLYRAVQDLGSALLFIEQQIEKENLWKIDTANFFIGGNSAGSITCLNYHFIDPNEENILSKYEPELGSWKKSSFAPKALINLCGAISDTLLISKPTPILSVHGSEDNIVPYKIATVDFKVPIVTTFPKVKLQGSSWIQQRSANLGSEAYLYTFQNQRHSPFDKMLEPHIYQPNMDVTINLMRNFLYNQIQFDVQIDIESNLHNPHTAECGIELTENEWRFYPVDKTIKKVHLKIEDPSGKTLFRKTVKKKLKAFLYAPNLKPGNYVLKVGYGTFQKTTPITIE